MGLYFCHTTMARKHIRSAATCVNLTKRDSRRSCHMTIDPMDLSRTLCLYLAQNKIDTSLDKISERLDGQGQRETLAYLKSQVVKNQLIKMTAKAGNPLTSRLLNKGSRGINAFRGRSNNAIKRVASPKSKQKTIETATPATKKNSAPLKEALPITKNIKKDTLPTEFDSVTTYRKLAQNYKVPSRLINLAAYSQLDPNSLFASQLRCVHQA
jgi:hypothetical protein